MKLGPDDLARQLDKARSTRAPCHLQCPFRHRARRPNHPLLVDQSEVSARYLAEPEFAFLLTEAALDPREVVAVVPGPPVLGVNPVDHQVDVGVLGVVVGDDQGLVLVEPEVAKGSVGDRFEPCPAEGFTPVEADRDVVGGFLDSPVLRCRGLHQHGDEVGVVGGQAAR